jgi:DNA ligase 1
MTLLTDPLMRPMLAATCGEFDKLRYPVLATPKLDGIRCLTIDPIITSNAKLQCQPVSRRLKPIPNDWIFTRLATESFPGLDGELVTGKTVNGKWITDPFNEISSKVMSHDSWPEFRYIVFDYGHNFVIRPPYPQVQYYKRMIILEELGVPDFVTKLMPVMIKDKDALLAYEAACLLEGYEGICIRTPESPYKLGRSTLKEQWLVKCKRFLDGEAEIIGMEELMHNDNPESKNDLGYTERSSHQANMRPSGMMGKLNLRALNDVGPIKKGTLFNLGTGFSEQQRQDFWDNRFIHNGFSIVKYRFQSHGVKDKPRVASYLGIRNPNDL